MLVQLGPSVKEALEHNVLEPEFGKVIINSVVINKGYIVITFITKGCEKHRVVIDASTWEITKR